MTKPLRHTTHEIKAAAKAAVDLGVTVRLEKDGAITFMPVINMEIEEKQVDDFPDGLL